MESAPSSICKVCQGIFQEGHRRRIRLRRIEEGLWESEDSAYKQDTYSNSSGENGQATTDPLNEEVDDYASKRTSDEENLDEETDEDTIEWSSEEDEHRQRPSNEEESDEAAKDHTSDGPSDKKGESRRSSDEDSDEIANEDATEVFPDDEDSRPSGFGGPDYFVYMHYPNLAMLQKSAQHCQSCHVLMHSLRSDNKISSFRGLMEQAQESEAQRLQELQSSGDRAQLAVLDEDGSDPNLDSALQMHVEIHYDDRTGWKLAPLLSPEKHGEGRLFLTFKEKRLDHEFVQYAKIDFFCKSRLEPSDSGHLKCEVAFLASPSEFEATCSPLLVET